MQTSPAPFATILLLTSLCRGAEPTTTPADLVPRATRSGLAICLPSTWRDATPKAEENLQLGFVNETGRQSLAVSAAPVTSDVTVDSSLRTVPDELKKGVPGFRLITTDVVTLGAERACRVVYERSTQGVVADQCEWLMVRNGFAYALVFTARADEFDAGLPLAEKVAQSIRIPNVAPLTVADFFIVAPPAGFADEPSTPKRVRYFAHRSADGRLTKTIQVDGGLAKMASAEQMARSLAGADGRIGTVDLDGTAGVRFESTSTAIERPRAGVIVFRNQRVFMLVATSTGEDVAADLDAAIHAWRWTRPAE